MLIPQKIWADSRVQDALWKDFHAYLTKRDPFYCAKPTKEAMKYRMTREKLASGTSVFPSVMPRCLISSQAKDTETTYLWIYEFWKDLICLFRKSS